MRLIAKQEVDAILLGFSKQRRVCFWVVFEELHVVNVFCQISWSERLVLAG